MKKLYTVALLTLIATFTYAQTPFERVYNTLNTKCQNTTCHSAASADALKFDGDINAVYAAIYNTTPQNSASVAKFEKQIKPGHPYMSFLLRKIAGSGFDTDLALDANEGDLMKDINGNQLTNKEIEFIRQWIMFSAKKTYANNDFKPNWQLVSDYYDNPTNAFLPKPIKPAANEGLQFRMGPVFLPATGEIEQEWLMQQEVNFPVVPEVYKVDGFMNQQSHHFLLFQFQDSAAIDRNANDPVGMQKVAMAGGSTSFDGDKFLTSAWQDDAEFNLPQGTALFWDKKSYLDMNYHVKNYNATAVLPCDFYFNIYFRPRSVQTIEMKANLVNNVGLFLTQGNQTRDYDDPANNLSTTEWRYIWALTSHTHKYGTDYDIYVRDSSGNIAEKIYEGFTDYTTGLTGNFYDWEHPSTRYENNFIPVKFGKHGTKKSGLVARTAWNIQEQFVTFGFTTNDEMQLFYYFYTSQDPRATVSINNPEAKNLQLSVYPNPMNGNGKVIYTLENDAVITANITDVSGKLITALAQENQVAGTHEINISGTGLAKGIYFLNLSVNGSVYAKKFVVTE
ncbi:MAG: T9SS type A sorting domain-containing protein [Chitinophagales bacterium]|nr:T9SS type A sorting domain-containing protein [Chitinophagales bacterium]